MRYIPFLLWICWKFSNFLITFADINDCRKNPCKNGGKCRDLINNFRCSCRKGFIGKTCNISKLALSLKFIPFQLWFCWTYSNFLLSLADINECRTRPCKNGGKCTDLVNDFKCSCRKGFTGKTCNISELALTIYCYINYGCKFLFLSNFLGQFSFLLSAKGLSRSNLFRLTHYFSMWRRRLYHCSADVRGKFWYLKPKFHNKIV